MSKGGEEHFDVVIVGAGAAGIAAGCRLLENKQHNVVILEAEDRVGGRLHTIPMGKGSLDLGAEWVHGEKGNPVYELASGLELLYVAGNPFENARMYQSTGKVYPTQMSAQLMQLIDEIIDHGDPDEIKAHKGSLGDFFIERYWPRVQPMIDRGQFTRAEAEDFLKWLEYVENSIDGSPSWQQTSADEVVEYVKMPGEILNAWKLGGYSTILDLITKKLPNPSKRIQIEDKIRLKKEVVRIDWSGDSALVVCADGSQFKAGRVLVTVSLNVLKATSHIFQPVLPQYKLDAIKGLGMGTVDKIFLEFPYRWWEPNTGGVSLVWRAEDVAQVPADLQWTTGVFGFYTEDNHPLNVMCGWVVGKHAEQMETASDQVVLEECMKLLRRFVGRTVEVPDAVSINRTKWFTNPHFRGSYSCRMIESNKLGVWPRHLAQPLTNSAGKQVVLFAGEATHDDYFSTVHGAVMSGWREADRILSYQNKIRSSLEGRKRRATVGIVGAGIAGLSAANTLAAVGVDVLVLEAQEAPGGRILSIHTDYGLLELGAQWLHGQNSELYKLAKEKDLLSAEESNEGEGRYCRPDGSSVSQELVTHVSNAVEQMLKDCEQFVSSCSCPPSVGHHLDLQFGEFKTKSRHSSSSICIMDELFKWHERFQLIDNSCDDLHNLSAKAWGNYKDCGTSHCINFSKGSTTLIENLMKTLPESTTVLFHSPVRYIEWIKEMEAKSRAPRVKIFTENDMEVLVDHVIVTASLGFLKENKNGMFSPALPDSLHKAIDTIGFGTITKLFLAYEEPWWSTDDKGFQFLWSDITQLPQTVPWASGVTGFDVMPGQAVLLGWVGGRSSLLVESTSEEKLMEQATLLLRVFTGNCKIPLPKCVIRSQWYTNEYVRGAYSHITSDCDDLNLSNETLALPVYSEVKNAFIDKSPTILLAGEACHSQHYSTVHGAYDSGQRQANIIIEYLHKTRGAKL